MEPGRDPLVLGPLLRHVDATSATVWVQTADRATVEVHAFGRRFSAPTFAAHGCHFALVRLEGLPAHAADSYRVTVAGRPVWPPAGWPAGVIRTIEPGSGPRLAFGSCRTSASHDAAGHRRHGVDALRTLALHLRPHPAATWPDLLVLLGDQVYADETPPPMQQVIRERRDPEEPPWYELRDFAEYAHLYRISWSDPAIRWLLASVPTAMIFDDHDIRDDWNTSLDWHREMNAKPWWHRRIVGGLGAYWVFQHLGNLGPDELPQDELFALALAHEAGASDVELDLTERLDAFAERVDAHPESYRWSYRRDLGNTRLVVVDSRAARALQPARRGMLDEAEMRWLDRQLTGDVDHLLIATSVPFWLVPAMHDLEAIDEAAAEGAWGGLVARAAETLRRAVDLEHWAAFSRSHSAVSELVSEVASGARGSPPASVVFLSGDVHHSYLARALTDARGSAVVQAVCSPLRNPMPRAARAVTRLLSGPAGAPLRRFGRRSPRVPQPSGGWEVTAGPWFDNCLATLVVTGRTVEITWYAARADPRPRLGRVTTQRVPAGAPPEFTSVPAQRAAAAAAVSPAVPVGSSSADDRRRRDSYRARRSGVKYSS